jgi:hypothetical protein
MKELSWLHILQQKTLNFLSLPKEAADVLQLNFIAKFKVTKERLDGIICCCCC